MLDPPPLRNQPLESQNGADESTRSSDSSSTNTLTSQSNTFPPSASSDNSNPSTDPQNNPENASAASHNPTMANAANAAIRLVRAIGSMQGNSPITMRTFPFSPQHSAAQSPSAQPPTNEAPLDLTPSSNTELPSIFPVNLLDLILSQGLAGLNRTDSHENGINTPRDGPNAGADSSEPNATGPASSESGPGTESTDSTQTNDPTTNGPQLPNRESIFGQLPFGQNGPSNLGEDIGAIIITINYAFANDNFPNPNRTGSLTISVPNTTSNRNPQTIHDFVSLATRIAYEELFSAAKTGITEEKFESFQVVPVDELTDRICSICFEPYDGLQPLQTMADSIAHKRRKLSPEEFTRAELEDREERDTSERDNTPLGGYSDDFASSANPPSTFATSGTATTESSDTSDTSGGNDSTRPTGPVYLCDQDKEFSHEPIKFPCGHIFGKSCLAHWLKTATTCPLCRFNVNAPSEGTEGSTNETPRDPGQNFFQFLTGNWMRPGAADDQARAQTQPQGQELQGQGSPSASQALSLASDASREHSQSTQANSGNSELRTTESGHATSLPTVSNASTAGADATSSESPADPTRRRSRGLSFLRRTTQDFLRRAARMDGPSVPFIPPGSGRTAPIPTDGADDSELDPNAPFQPRRFNVRNPSFAPVIEGISNILRASPRPHADRLRDNSLFATGVSSRRTAEGVETTTTDDFAPTTPSGDSIIIISPNYLLSRLHQHDAARPNAQDNENDTPATDRNDDTLHSNNDTQ